MSYQLNYADPPGGVSRIELHARTSADGWDCWGNRCDSSVQLIAGRVA